MDNFFNGYKYKNTFIRILSYSLTALPVTQSASPNTESTAIF
jgi:hypothetical protein